MTTAVKIALDSATAHVAKMQASADVLLARLHFAESQGGLPATDRDLIEDAQSLVNALERLSTRVKDAATEKGVPA